MNGHDSQTEPRVFERNVECRPDADTIRLRPDTDTIRPDRITLFPAA
jgi:hypothetical protein